MTLDTAITERSYLKVSLVVSSVFKLGERRVPISARLLSADSLFPALQFKSLSIYKWTEQRPLTNANYAAMQIGKLFLETYITRFKN